MLTQYSSKFQVKVSFKTQDKLSAVKVYKGQRHKENILNSEGMNKGRKEVDQNESEIQQGKYLFL